MIEAFDEIITILKELGFTEYEAKVYLSLLEQHPATAYTISQKSGVPHARVYDITRRLIDKEIALLASENPNRFSPLAPKELITKLNKEHDDSISKLDDKLKKISFISDFDPVWNISNKNDALNKTKEIILRAAKTIFIGIWDEELAEMLPILEKAAANGVEIVFLIYGNSAVNFGEVFHHSTESLDEDQKLGHTIDCVVDSSICITGGLGQNGKNCQVVWTQNKGLVKSIEEYIIHDFYIAEIQNVLEPEISKRFGNHLSLLREKYRRSVK